MQEKSSTGQSGFNWKTNVKMELVIVVFLWSPRPLNPK